MNGPYEWSKNNVCNPRITEASYTYTALEEDTGIFILKVQTIGQAYRQYHFKAMERECY
jgi:hypothetical protein